MGKKIALGAELWSPRLTTFETIEQKTIFILLSGLSDTNPRVWGDVSLGC